jgi:translation initiation factor IF-2
MEQRPLRVGENVDDYCPRERRITNHIIVALVGTAIRQTRCSTCDAEHVFKAGRLPPKPRAVMKDEPPSAPLDGHPHIESEHSEHTPAEAAPSAAGERRPDEIWSGHRPLIRASLPRTQNDQPVARPIPEFTMHQRNVRGGHAFRQGQPWHDRPFDGRNGFRHAGGNGNGNGASHANGKAANGDAEDDSFGNSFGNPSRPRPAGHVPGPGGGNGRPGGGPGGPGGGGGRRRRRGHRKPGGPR